MRDYIDKRYDNMCCNCKHFHGLFCEAFDWIPDEFKLDSRKHDHVVESQKGDFVFEPIGEDTMRVYTLE